MKIVTVLGLMFSQLLLWQFKSPQPLRHLCWWFFPTVKLCSAFISRVRLFSLLFSSPFSSLLFSSLLFSSLLISSLVDSSSHQSPSEAQSHFPRCTVCYLVSLCVSVVTNDHSSTGPFFKVKDQKCIIVLWLDMLSHFHILSAKYIKKKGNDFFVAQ